MPRIFTVIELACLNRETWRLFTTVSGTPEQASHCSSALGIIARAYAHRGMDADAWGITVDGEPAGIIMWWTLTRKTGERLLVVDHLLIDARWQCQGLGRWAIEQARDEARRRACTGLTCVVIAGNTESEALMGATGFRRDPEHDDEDELAYVADLSPVMTTPATGR